MNVEALRGPTIETINSTEALAERRRFYHAIRNLFDTSNDLGIKVNRIPDDTSQPHKSDREINALLYVAEEDRPYVNTSQLKVHLRFFAESEAIRLDIVPVGRDSEGYGGVLLPDGLIIPRIPFFNTQQEEDTNTAKVHRTFMLFKKALDERRVRDPDSFDPNRYGIEVGLRSAIPGFPAAVYVDLTDTGVKLNNNGLHHGFNDNSRKPLEPDQMIPKAEELIRALQAQNNVATVEAFPSCIVITLKDDKIEMGIIGRESALTAVGTLSLAQLNGKPHEMTYEVL